jgi:nitrogen regulatory protein PII
MRSLSGIGEVLMNKVEVIVSPKFCDDILMAIEKIGSFDIMVTEIVSYTKMSACLPQWSGQRVFPKSKIEALCDDKDVRAIEEAIFSCSALDMNSRVKVLVTPIKMNEYTFQGALSALSLAVCAES